MIPEIILKQIEQNITSLSINEQLKLLEWLSHKIRIKSKSEAKSYDLNLLYGSGKGLWENQDAQDYVNNLREERI